MKKVSARKRKELRETDELRHAYIEAGGLCERCLIAQATQCHEITAGAHRQRAVYEMNAQLYLCETCHQILQGTPYAFQIAVTIKAMVDAVNRCHGSRAVTMDSVIAALRGQP